MATFVGPVALSGLGQVLRKYAKLVGGKYIEYGEPFGGGILVSVVLPVPSILEILKRYKAKATKSIWLTVCETETVHEDYQKIFELSDTFWVPSEFCSAVLKRQFPQGNFPVLRNYAGPPLVPEPVPLPNLIGKFVFYHIGNIIDIRKNNNALMECFLRAQIPDSVLLIKATCLHKIDWKVPGVVVIQDFLSDNQMESIHAAGHCYVSMSHSEGAGMGAVEAALRGKTVIVPEYGATKEYVPSAFLVKCTAGEVPVDDFLFKKGMVWGEPSKEHMIELMRRVAQTHVSMRSVKQQLLEIFESS
jgi:glycosyltransferase involved in cell wall biosynthesis